MKGLTEAHFNSIKVRLERELPLQQNEMSSLFQFHKGTIRTYEGAFLDSLRSISIP